MRFSHHFGSTLRESPTNIDVVSHQLLVRAGFIRQLGQGLFSYLPLARRSLTKIENILRDEMNTIGGQEMTMPVAHPAEVWQATGRWYSIGPEMARFRDRKERQMVLAMTHEEVVADLCKTQIRSYRQLPQLVYHIQTKFRDDPRPRAGLIRVREFTMKDSYSLDSDEAGLDRQYRAHYQAYFNIFSRCDLPVIAVSSDVGMMGGSLAHEYMYLTPIGEDTLVLCSQCGYAANRQIAFFAKPAAPVEDLKPIEKVATPGCKTIDAVTNLLDLPKRKTAKVVFMMAGHEEETGEREGILCAVVRGDMDVNETKLANAAQANWLRPATDEEICATGAIPGYASPVGLHGVKVIVDDAVSTSPNLVGGANEADYHLRNINIPRDYEPTVVADIAAAGDCDACIRCGQSLRTSRGVEVGNIFKLGTRYSSAVGAMFLAADGTQKPIVMGSYGIGSGRLLACIAEEHHDDKGLMWPITVAPYTVHLVSLGQNAAADRFYETLLKDGIEVLYDDREESPGVKFIEADLIGIPIRITISARSLAKGGAEMKRRDQSKTEILTEASVAVRLKQEINSLSDRIMSKLVEVPFK